MWSSSFLYFFKTKLFLKECYNILVSFQCIMVQLRSIYNISVETCCMLYINIFFSILNAKCEVQNFNVSFYCNLFGKLKIKNPELLCCLRSEVLKITLREKCPNAEFFLVHISPHSNWIWRDSPYSARMRENTDQKKVRIWTLFRKWCYLFCTTPLNDCF